MRGGAVGLASFKGSSGIPSAFSSFWISLLRFFSTPSIWARSAFPFSFRTPTEVE